MKYLIFLSILFVTGNVFCQQPEVVWGPEYDGGDKVLKILNSDQQYFYVLFNATQGMEIMKFDHNGRLVSTEKANSYSGEKGLNIFDVFEFNGTSYSLLNRIAFGQNKYEVFIAEFEKERAESSTRKVLEMSVPVQMSTFPSMDKFEGGVDVVVSPGNTYVVFFGQTMTMKLDQILFMSVYDRELKNIWQKEYKLSDKKQNYDFGKVYLDDKGNAYMSKREWNSDSDKVKGVPKYDYKILKLGVHGVEEININLGTTKAPIDLGMFFADDNTIKLGGLYTDRSNPKVRANGVFFANIGASGKLDYRVHKFETDFLQDIQRDKQIEKGSGLKGYRINEIIQFNDGSYGFMAEKSYIHQKTIRDDMNIPATYTDYFSEEIIIPRFSSEGELVNIAKIDKDLKSTSYKYGSFSWASDGKNIVMLYNDDKTKEELKKLNNSVGKNNLFTDLARVDQDGKVVIKHLFDSKELNKEFLPLMSLKLEDNKLLVYVVGKNKFQFGVLAYN